MVRRVMLDLLVGEWMMVGRMVFDRRWNALDVFVFRRRWNKRRS